MGLLTAGLTAVAFAVLQPVVSDEFLGEPTRPDTEARSTLDTVEVNRILDGPLADPEGPRRSLSTQGEAIPRPWVRETPAIDARGWVEVQIRAIGPTARDGLKADLPFRVQATGLSEGEEAYSVEGRTDGAGEARFFVPPEVLERAREDSGVRLEFRPSLEGLQRRFVEVVPRRNLRGVYRTIIKLRSGCSVVGYVLGAGEPVTGARIRGEYPGKPGRSPRISAEQSLDGRFHLHFEDVETPSRITAERKGSGTAVLDGVVPSEHSADDDLLLIQLNGHGVVRGQVVDALGDPFAGIKIIVEHQESGIRGSPEYRPPSRLEGADEGMGHLGASVFSDSEGRFEASGLLDGDYYVYAWHRALAGGYALLTETPISSDGHLATFRVEAPTLVVHLLDASGAPYRGSCEGGYRRGFGHPEWFQAWPENLEILCLLREESLSTHCSYPASHGGVPLGDGRWSFSVLSGTDYEVGVCGPGRPWSPVAVRSPSDGRAHHLWIRVPDALGQGSLSVTLLDEFGEIAEGHAWVRVLDAVSERVLIRRLNYRQSGGPWPIRIMLPEGSYIVEGLGANRESESDGSIVRFKECGGARAPVSIRADTTEFLTMTLPVGGRVRLFVGGEPGEHDFSDPQRVVEFNSEGDPGAVDRQALLARTVLRRGSGTPQFLEFPHVEPARPEPRNHAVPGVLLGTRATSLPVPAGRYELIAFLPDRRSVSRMIDVVDGETLDAVLEFE